MDFRADLHGLRGIAVVIAVVFHIAPQLIPGGFIALDIFFVMSGYLITGILLASIKNNEFSFKEFYRRRILRILPVINVVIISSLIVGHFLLLPPDLLGLAESGVTSMLSVANIYFAYNLDTSYFAPESLHIPLLHLWSMGVEEQFYILWPLFVLFFVKRRATTLFVLATSAIVVCSIIYAQSILATRPMEAYYLLQSRGGALALGALAMLASSNLKQRNMVLPETSLWLGWLVIFVFLFVLEKQAYPGYSSILPLLGISLLLIAGDNKTSIITKVLASKWLVFLGAISYSLYLWHWPILSFYRYLFGTDLSLTEGAVLFLISVGVGYFSYKFIETPMRKSRLTFGLAFSSMLLLPVLLSLFIYYFFIQTNGFGGYSKSEYKASYFALKRIDRNTTEYHYICQHKRVELFHLKEERCLINETKEPKVLLWGDSNAAHFVGFLGELSIAWGGGFRNIAHSGCAPILFDVERSSPTGREEDCTHSIESVRSEILNYDTIILAAGWSIYVDQNADFMEALKDTINFLSKAGKKVLIIGQIPNLPSFDRNCEYKAIKFELLDCMKQSEKIGIPEEKNNQIIEDLVRNISGTEYFDLNNLLCLNGTCNAYLNEFQVYYDYRHLSNEGSWKLGKYFTSHFELPETLENLKGKWANQQPREYDLLGSLDARVKNKFRLVSEQGISVRDGFEIYAHQEKRSDSKKYEDTLFLTDDSSSQYQVAKVELNLPDESMSKVLIMVDFYIEERNNPLFRLQIKSEGKTDNFDMLFDSQRQYLKAKGKAKIDTIYLDRINQSHFRAYLSASSDTLDSVSLHIFPAASLDGARNSKLGVGNINLKDVRYLLSN